MRVGLVGAGKLGLPLGLVIDNAGHTVFAHDLDGRVEKYLEEGQVPYKEEGIQPYLDRHEIIWKDSVEQVVQESELILVAVQTPHGPEYEGTTLLPETRADFDYQYLVKAISDISAECDRLAMSRTVGVISTCLPGTFNREIAPVLGQYVDYAYIPQFIAMGTTIHDFLNPEFNLVGFRDDVAARHVQELLRSLNNAPFVTTDITTAEGIKVSYNTWITAKTVVANSWGEACHRIGMNFADMKKAWDLAGNRLLSKKYMEAGMSDGGGCHPRDNIALSWMANEIGMSHNIWEDLMTARQEHEAWLADEAQHAHQTFYPDQPLVILGRSFKPETNIETGSPAVLMANILRDRGVDFIHVEDLPHSELQRAVYFIATQHERYVGYLFPQDSIVLDPFGYIPHRPGVGVVWIGRW